MAIGALVLFALQELSGLASISKWLIAWNIGTLTYLLLVYRMARQADRQGVLQKTQTQYEDEGQSVILLMPVTAAVVSVVAIVWELSMSAYWHDDYKSPHHPDLFDHHAVLVVDSCDVCPALRPRLLPGGGPWTQSGPVFPGRRGTRLP